MFNLNLANSVSVFIGATVVTSQDNLLTGETSTVTLTDVYDLVKELHATLVASGEVSSIDTLDTVVPVVETPSAE